ILWIDEIEKAFSSQSGTDGGTSRRMFGSFLTWMQEKSGEVFVFASANDISSLPPELLRKGRFDEIFFVDLPHHEVRKDIFALHLPKRQFDLRSFDLDALAGAAEGFSGAEIEQAVLSALFTSLADEVPVTDDLVINEIKSTRPLSVTMAEKVGALREWAKERAVFVDQPPTRL
ncbi:MAG: AAA family ATPase, partial [Polyangiaceae bacterium]|nr:AAA family ATPase [Polyangiaceae bacterium]